MTNRMVTAQTTWCLIAALAVSAIASAAAAAPTGLNIIPTADLLGAGEAALEYEVDGVHLFDSDCSSWALLQIGVSDRVELGVDRCLDGETGNFANAKILLAGERRGPAIALGIQNVARDADAQPYLTLAMDLGGARLHLGGIRIDGDLEGVAGLEHGIGDHLSVLLDHVTGPDAATGLGLSTEVSSGLSLTVARIFAHVSDGDDSWQLLVSGSPAVHF